MADSNGQQDKRRRRKKGKRQANLIRALDHELRRQILRLLEESEEAQSPIKISKLLKRPLTNVSYHVSVLRRLDAVTETAQGQVRGAMEHFYKSSLKDNAPIQALLEETREADESPEPRKGKG
jgi:DNA-binding transcriptional ArsR family regulator